MPVNRRRLLQALTLAPASQSANAQPQTSTPLDTLRHVAEAHGVNLSEERLRTIQPALALRLTQLQAVRRVELPDSIAPAPSLLP